MGWWQRAKVGDKIVCVDGNFKNLFGMDKYEPEFPKGAVVTISNIYPTSFSVCGIALELDGCWHHYTPEHFRPITPKSTDKSIALLKSILNGQRVPEDA